MRNPIVGVDSEWEEELLNLILVGTVIKKCGLRVDDESSIGVLVAPYRIPLFLHRRDRDASHGLRAAVGTHDRLRHRHLLNIGHWVRGVEDGAALGALVALLLSLELPPLPFLDDLIVFDQRVTHPMHTTDHGSLAARDLSTARTYHLPVRLGAVLTNISIQGQ